MNFNLKCHLYHDTGKCPKCNSVKTGYYIHIPNSNAFSLIEKQLKCGEFIKIHNSDTRLNTFCLNCGISYLGSLHVKLITTNELNKIKEEKGIDSALASMQKYKTSIKPYKVSKKKDMSYFFNQIKLFAQRYIEHILPF